MRITIKTKNLEQTEEIKNFVEEKIRGLEKFISVLKQDIPNGQKTLAEVLLDIERETMHHQKGEIFQSRMEINLPGKRLVVKGRGEDFKEAIIDAREEMEKEIKKFKFKMIENPRRLQRKINNELK